MIKISAIHWIHIALFCAFFFSVSFVVTPSTLFSQEAGLDIARTYAISTSTTDVEFGDIVSFERAAGLYRLAQGASDEKMFGVAVEDPTIVLETVPDGLPIVGGGDVLVNVTTLSGVIEVGDFITSSPIPGKGQRAESEDTYVLGVALEAFDGTLGTTTLTYNDAQYSVGQIVVLLVIGSRQEALAEISTKITTETTGLTQATILNIIQFSIAALIALGAIYIAFRNFGPNIKSGIVSIGRNPLAKSSIQSMVILNVILILLVSAAGLFAGLAIILLPI